MKLKSIALAGIIAAFGAKAQAQANVDVNSSYVSRGMVFGPGPAVQPSINLTNGQFTGLAWLNRDPKLGVNELDLYFRLAHEFSGVRVEASYAKDFFWHSSLTETQEVDLSVTAGKLSGLLVHDFRSGKGQYLEASYAAPASQKFPVAIRFALGYNNHYFRQTSSFSHLEGKVQLPLSIAGFSVTPSFTYVKALANNFQDKPVIGLSVSKSF